MIFFLGMNLFAIIVLGIVIRGATTATTGDVGSGSVHSTSSARESLRRFAFKGCLALIRSIVLLSSHHGRLELCLTGISESATHSYKVLSLWFPGVNRNCSTLEPIKSMMF